MWLTICRRRDRGTGYSVCGDRLPLADPLGESPTEIDHVAHALPQEETRGDRGATAALALHDDRPLAREFGEARGEVAEGQVERAGHVSRIPLRALSHVHDGDFAAMEPRREL